MAKKAGNVKAVKANSKPETNIKNDKSIEEIEEDLQLPESSEDEEDDEEEELSEESEGDDDEEDDDDDLEGLSSEDDEEEQIEEIKIQTKTSGHTVNKVINKEQSSGSATANKKSKTGIIYIGRLPNGFQEAELTQYFEQFGNIINLKLSRNKKTGKSKHFGFIEFDNLEVAKIAAETMNNYLLFGHLIKCEVVVESSLNGKDLFKGSDRKFKVIPWKKISKHKHDKPKSEKKWTKLVAGFEKQKEAKQKELKSKGIDFDLNNI
ncbi:uncharacterized protein RJT21DRAFT_42191 [Scheffersomyces amazonensis]|uniref:uncharacterized protein n=1 Tax=Scheffersomyces amazonensis TaxID=1078765 RepID=UPI00315DECF1